MLLKSKEAMSLSASAYDRMLASGWFRGARFMNKPDYICVEGDLFSPVHIRLELETHSTRKSHRKILSKNNKRFTCEIRPASVDADLEVLYQNQKVDFQAFIYPKLEEAILTSDNLFSFRTYCLRVFDDTRLVAASFFDIGKNSMASLLGLYDKEYSKYSLGTYTMLREIDLARHLELKYYYPGYVLDNLKIFGYKLQLGEMRFKDPSGRWTDLSKYNREKTKSAAYKKKFQAFISWLNKKNISGEVKVYPLHYAYNPHLEQSHFYRYPLFYEVLIGNHRFAASYDPEKDTFVWSQISTSPFYERLLMGLEMSKDLKETPNYEVSLLECQNEIHLPSFMLGNDQMSNSIPTGQWSDPITSFKMNASLK